MITTVSADMTWGGKVGKMLATQSEKKIKKTLKDMTGADDIEIIAVDSWEEENEDGSE